MKKYLLIFIIFIQANLLFSQAPVVSNVSFTQRTDGSLIIDIYYDLADTDAETKKIEIVASDDNGSTWDLPCTSLTGDVGMGVTLGTGKHVIWDFYADNPNQSGSQYKVRVTASEVGTMTGNDGKTYQTVKIGNQWWMAENLKETQYRNGNDIPEETDNTTWAGLSTGARCACNNSESTANTYGYLYNWYAVDDARNIAPSGWHVPTDAEWTTLTTYLGADAGSKLAGRADLWFDGNLKNNSAFGESGFSALPGGYRSIGGVFSGLGYFAYFWSATEYDISYAWFRYLGYYFSEIGRSSYDKHSGCSVRLVRDN